MDRLAKVDGPGARRRDLVVVQLAIEGGNSG